MTVRLNICSNSFMVKYSSMSPKKTGEQLFKVYFKMQLLYIFYYSFVSLEKKNQRYSSSTVTLFRSMEVRLGVENPAGTIYEYHIDLLFPAPPPTPLCSYEGRTINTMSKGRIPQCLVLLLHGSVTQWFSLHHHHQHHH
jgi:hypothetical protein